MSMSVADKPSALRDWHYCDSILTEVSRTFAINIRTLGGELRRATTVAYLLCRILDTVEDTTGISNARKRELLLGFEKLARTELRDLKGLQEWVNATHELEGTPSELNLVRNTLIVARVLQPTPAAMRQAVCRAVGIMAQGMAEFCVRKPCVDFPTALRDEADLESYCYYVAGVVGEMLTELFGAASPGITQDALAAMKERSVSFGLALQVTNITKDFIRDARRGTCFVPESYLQGAGLNRVRLEKDADPQAVREVVVALSRKALSHLDDAMTYTLAIPRRYWRLRLFCLWPLMMAVASLDRVCAQPDRLAQGATVKISRSEVRSIVARSTATVLSNRLLRREYGRFRSKIAAVLAPERSDSPQHRAA